MHRDEVTRDLGRIFLGRDLQCAQCHDHRTVDDYLQRLYFGLIAFINRSYLFKAPKTGVTSIGEKAEKDCSLLLRENSFKGAFFRGALGDHH
nr:DUF1549 domain-containing protein [Roseimaritima multifibrata]